MQEELFGPVFVLHSFGEPENTTQSTFDFNVDKLINKLNKVNYGLSAVLCSTNEQIIEHIPSQIETGTVFINHPSTSTSEFPFGGVKRSGFGRECGPFALGSLTDIKSINLSNLTT